MYKIGFITLGCKVNIYESNAIKDEFIKKGYLVSDADPSCDAFIINTCSVTNQADAKSRQMIHKCHKLNPNAIIAVMGCYSQSNPEAKTLPDIDILLGNNNKHEAVTKIIEMLNTKKYRYVNLLDILKEKEYEPLEVTMFDHTRAFVKIEDGCQNFCTYCVIPFARGPVRSKDADKVIEEIKGVSERGYKEVVLSGIDTGKYYDKKSNTNFSKLCRRIIDEVPGIKRLRISSIEITQITPDFIELLHDSKVIADHMHLPIQSGSDNILNMMKRFYTTKEFKERVDLIKSVRPDISLSSDVIVGFPTETDLDHKNSMKFIESLGMTHLHVFPFSKRAGTRAADFPDIDPQIKKVRTKEMMDLSYKLERRYNSKFLDKTLDVIFEQKDNKGRIVGHSSNFIEIAVDGDESLIGRYANVHIKSIDGLKLIGDIVSFID